MYAVQGPARDLYERTLKLREAALPTDHADIAEGYSTLGIFLVRPENKA